MSKNLKNTVGHTEIKAHAERQGLNNPRDHVRRNFFTLDL
jgi:hypothetical protein